MNNFHQNETQEFPNESLDNDKSNEDKSDILQVSVEKIEEDLE